MLINCVNRYTYLEIVVMPKFLFCYRRDIIRSDLEALTQQISLM